MKRAEACRPLIGPDGRYLYPCVYCQKTFCSLSDLNRHINFHEGMSGFFFRLSSFILYKKKMIAQFSLFCHTNYLSVFIFLFVSLKIKQDVRPFKCEFCDYQSRTNSQLKVHMMRHAGNNMSVGGYHDSQL